LPTITHRPRWGSPSGSTIDFVFAEEQIAQLAVVLDVDPADIAGPLNDVAGWYGRYAYVLYAEPSDTEQKQALRETAEHAGDLLSAVRSLDQISRQHLLDEYAGGPRKPKKCSEHATKEDGHLTYVWRDETGNALPFSKSGWREKKAASNALPFSEIGWREKKAALANFNADIDGLARLWENLTVAQKRIKPAEGRPPKLLQSFAKRELKAVYEQLPLPAVSTRKEARRRSQFLARAERMLIDNAHRMQIDNANNYPPR